MQILFVLPPYWTTPPPGYGGIETLAAALVPALRDAGAQLTVCAPEGSVLPGIKLHALTRPLNDGAPHTYASLTPKIEKYISRVMEVAWRGDFDVIHDFSGMLSMTNTLAAPLPSSDYPPLIHTIHTPIEPFRDNFAELSHYDRLTFVAISYAQMREGTKRLQLRSQVIHNCLNPADYTPGPGGHRLLVMGEFGSHKGQDRLIRYCSEAGLELDVAGPVAGITDRIEIEAEAAKGARSAYAGDAAFELYRSVRHLIDGRRIKFHGNVAGKFKQHLLGHASALVMPHRWSEPFGMVAIEAMATGTPVVAMRGGALPEIIQPGDSGYLASTFGDLCGLLHPAALAQLNRSLCRPHVVANFAARSIAKKYMELYQRVSQPQTVAKAATASLKLALRRPQPQAAILYERIPAPRRRAKPQI